MYHYTNNHSFASLLFSTCSVVTVSFIANPAFANNQFNITKPQYLSEVLKSAETKSMYDTNATTWLSSAEIEKQTQQQKAIIAELRQKNSVKNGWLIKWMKSLPVTGRVPVLINDYKLMEANVYLNPLLRSGDVVRLYDTKDTITVIASNGKVCQLPFVVSQDAKAYVRGCNFKVDFAYIIHANGRVSSQQFGSWQQQSSNKITAGSTLWLPVTDNKLGYKLDNKIARFIATQSVNLPLPQVAIHALPDINVTADKKQKFTPSYSDWGTTGLMQTPTARMQKAGNVSLTMSKNDPYSLYTTVLQPYDNLEVGFRFADIGDRLYGNADDDGNKSLKDKSLSVKLQLLEEDKLRPSVAIGMRDPLGTGLFDGEYIVANKRFNNLDASLGLGFGYLGRRGDSKNPFSFIDDSYKERQSDRSNFGGTANYKNWFTGKTALFGGVHWQTPYEPLSVKVEYEGNDYSKEPSKDGRLQVDSPINLGVQWHSDDVNVNVGYQRGNQLTAAVTLHDNIADVVTAPKPKLPESVEKAKNAVNVKKYVKQAISGSPQQTNLTNTLSKITGLNVVDVVKNKNNWRIVVNKDVGIYVRRKIERSIGLLHQSAPASVSQFNFDVYTQNQVLKTITVDRKKWVTNNSSYMTPSLKKEHMQDTFVNTNTGNYKINRKLDYHIAPTVSHSFGGPDGFLYAIDANAGVNAPLWKNGWLDADAKVDVYNNYDQYDYDGPSNLPRVRTDIRKYATTSKVKLSRAQVNHMQKISPNTFALGYAGYLEPMYAGVGGEVLYRPHNSHWAVGADINAVQKRDFDQGFGLQDYKVVTGHVNAHWDTGIKGVEVKAKAGRYLAGDLGATLDVSKKFDNGAKMGAWATKTNVSAEEFGEGRFDKGIYFTVPLDAVVENVSKKNIGVTWKPLLRDGGAVLNRKNKLWNMTKARDPKLLEYKTKEWK